MINSDNAVRRSTPDDPKRSVRHYSIEQDREAGHLVSFCQDASQDNGESASAAPSVPAAVHTARYIASMLEALEAMAHRSGLDVLSLMIAMAHDQALSESEPKGKSKRV